MEDPILKITLDGAPTDFIGTLEQAAIALQVDDPARLGYELESYRQDAVEVVIPRFVRDVAASIAPTGTPEEIALALSLDEAATRLVEREDPEYLAAKIAEVEVVLALAAEAKGMTSVELAKEHVDANAKRIIAAIYRSSLAPQAIAAVEGAGSVAEIDAALAESKARAAEMAAAVGVELD